jgi:uncharacterized protein YjdB
MRLARLIPTLALAMLSGCAGVEPVAPDPDAASSIRVTAYTAGTSIATLAVEVTAADIPTALVFNLVVDGETETASGTLRVKPGIARTFSVTAFDDAGAVTHEGEATVDVEPGQNSPLQIKLGPRSGQVPVTVTFGSWSVVITPANTVLEVGGTAGLVAEVLDDEGQPVADPAGLRWATTNPAIVAVDAAGTVTGVAPGIASIVATFEGVAGIATVEVD